MFTGLITHLGTLTSVSGDGMKRFRVESGLPLKDLTLGASVSHAGCCLTIVAAGETDADTRWHEVEVSAETLRVTTLGQWIAGQRINLEASLRLGDEIGGHLVTGHVDGLGTVTDMEQEAGSWRFTIEAPDALAPMIADRGSIAIDGVSLTVVGVEMNRFVVNIIPHTADVTSLSHLRAGDTVNLEADMLARYVARQTQWAQSNQQQG